MQVGVDITHKITQSIEPSLDAMGYRIVLVKLTEASRRRTLMVMAERRDDVSMSFDDCTEISRTVSALLDVEDPITGAYDLEVCSPGIERPLTRAEDFRRFAGHQAKLETHVPVNGRKRFKGVIQGIDGETIQLDMPEGQALIPLRAVRTGKLSPEPEKPVKPVARKKPKAKQANT